MSRKKSEPRLDPSLPSAPQDAPEGAGECSTPAENDAGRDDPQDVPPSDISDGRTAKRRRRPFVLRSTLRAVPRCDAIRVG